MKTIKFLLKGCLGVFATVFMFSIMASMVAAVFFEEEEVESEAIATQQSGMPEVADSLELPEKDTLQKRSNALPPQ